MTKNLNVATLKQQADETLRTKSLFQKAMWRIRHDYLTLVAIFVLVFLTLASYAAPLVVSALDVVYNDEDPYRRELGVGATASESDTTVYLWSVERGAIYRPMVAHINAPLDIAFSTTDNVFVTGSVDGTVRIWKINTGGNRKIEENQITETAHTDAVNGVAFSPDDTLIATASSDGTAKVWLTEKSQTDRENDIPLQVLTDHTDAVISVAFGPDGATLVTGSADGTAILWDTTTGESLHVLEGHTDIVLDVAYSSEGMIATAGADSTIRIWDSETGDVVFVLEGHEGEVRSIAFSSDGKQLASGGADQIVRLWDVDAGEVVSSFEGHTGMINSVDFTLDGTQLASGSADTSIRFWDVSTGDVVIYGGEDSEDEKNFMSEVTGVSVSDSGEWFVTSQTGRERTFVLGTDTSGRDHITRLLYGGQVSLRIGFLAALGSITIGIVIGVTTGFFGGIVDDFVIWFITTLNSIPQLFLLLIISALLAPNDTSLILVLVFLGWTGTTRIVRGETFALREREFILAARAVGASNLRIMFIHIVPNVVSLLLIVMTRAIGGLILAESTLSFLGFGVKPPIATWGNMLSSDFGLFRESPHLVFAPGLLISVTVLCLYIVGDGLRDAFDPRQSD